MECPVWLEQITYAMIKALNKLTGLGMPETQCTV